MNFQPPDPVCSKCGAETPPCDCDYEAQEMTTPERGLFERIEPFLESLHPNSAWRNRIKAEIEKFERRLAEAERDARNRDMWKGQCERQAEELTKLRARCGELEGLVTEAEKRIAALQIIAESVAYALEKAGFTYVDDPGESISILADERDELKQALATRLVQNFLALTAAPQPAQEQK